MHYSVEPNEMMGFIDFINSGDFYANNAKSKWVKKHPELKDTEFESLTSFVSSYNLQARKEERCPFTEWLENYLPDIHNISDLKKKILEHSDIIDKKDLCNKIDSIYPFYHEFFENFTESLQLQGRANKIMQVMNTTKALPMDNVARFFNYKIQEEHTAVTYIYPTEQSSGTSFETIKGTAQAYGFSADISARLNMPYTPIYHEKVHGIFSESGAQKELCQYLNKNNPIVQSMQRYPQLKRNPTLSNITETEQMVNEVLTTAFQGIYEEELIEEMTGRKTKLRDELYKDPVINTMAHKMIPVLKNALKTGETFGVKFMKKFEAEFIRAIPEMKNKIVRKQEKTSLITKFVETAKKERNTEKKTIFPKWLQNPSWLWHKDSSR